MAAEIVHQGGQLVVAAALDKRADRTLIADLVVKPLAPRRSALKHQGRIKLVRTVIDPAAQNVAARFGKCRLLQRAVFEQNHVPAEIAKQILITLPQSLADDSVETLPVIIDDPPAIAQTLLPAFEHGFKDVALIEFGIAEESNHAAFGPRQTPAMGPHIILRQGRKQRLSNAKSDRAGREVDVIGVLGPRRIGLRAFIAAKRFELVPGLAPEQVLDRVEIGRSV